MPAKIRSKTTTQKIKVQAAASPEAAALEAWGANPEPVPVPMVDVFEPEIIEPKPKVTATLMTHCGAWDVSREKLATYLIPNVPKSTDGRAFHPVAHTEWVDLVEEQLGNLGLVVKQQTFAVTHADHEKAAAKDAIPGAKMFGVMTLGGDNIITASDFEIALGLRSAYDRSFSFALALGQRVFNCDNLSFSSEVISTRKHTVYAMRDMPGIIARMVQNLLDFQQVLERETAALKGWDLTDADADHLIIGAFRKGVLPICHVPDVVENWHNPKGANPEEFAPRTAWTLQNAFTESMKARKPWVQWKETVGLTKMLREEMLTRKMIPRTISVA